MLKIKKVVLFRPPEEGNPETNSLMGRLTDTIAEEAGQQPVYLVFDRHKTVVAAIQMIATRVSLMGSTQSTSLANYSPATLEGVDEVLKNQGETVVVIGIRDFEVGLMLSNHLSQKLEIGDHPGSLKAGQFIVFDIEKKSYRFSAT